MAAGVWAPGFSHLTAPLHPGSTLLVLCHEHLEGLNRNTRGPRTWRGLAEPACISFLPSGNTWTGRAAAWGHTAQHWPRLET